MFFSIWAASTPSGGTAPAGGGALGLLFTLLPFILLMYFLIYRPQKKQQEVHRRLIATLKKGDRVVTAGGMIGEVTAIDDDEVRLRLAEKVEARFVKSSISRILKG